MFPLHARLSGKVKYIHMACILLGIVLSLIPIITSMADFTVDLQKQMKIQHLNFGTTCSYQEERGLRLTVLFPILCSCINHDAIFYSYVLTSDIMLGCGCTLLFIAGWFIHKLYKRNRVQVTKYNIYLELTIQIMANIVKICFYFHSQIPSSRSVIC